MNRNYRNVIIRGSISFVYIRILKGECKMSNVTIQKRGKYYQYKFEIAKVDGKRKFANKSGFKTKAEAEREGIIEYNNYFILFNRHLFLCMGAML